METKKLLILLSIFCFTINLPIYSQNPYKAPLYWNPYEYNIVHDDYIPENEWSANIDWFEQNLKPYGYNMICIDGWGDDESYNEHGYRTKHSRFWNHDYEWWSNNLQSRGMELGIYNNPLWVNEFAANAGVKIKGTNIPLLSLINYDENATWFKWVQVDRPGAEEYVKGYIQYYADMGVKYLRVDFLSWFEDGFDKNMGRVGPERPHEHYVTALRWMKEACDSNNMFLSLVMPHLKNEAYEEERFGHMIRINEDAGFESAWERFNNFERGIRHNWWSQYYNAFDGYTYWSYIAGRNKIILDGDFIRLNTFANNDEKKSVISLHLMAGGPISVSDQYSTIGNDLWLYQNTEMLALNADGFVGKPLFTNDPTDEASQVWAGQMSNGDWIVGLFNREDNMRNRSLDFSWLGITGNATVRDLWDHQDLGEMSSCSFDVPAHGCVIIKVVPADQPEMYIGASFGSWSPGNFQMTLENEVWVAKDINLSMGNHELKFANTTDWSGDDWGDAQGLSGIASKTTGGGANISFSISTSGFYTIVFNESTLAYSIVNQDSNGLILGATYSILAKHSGKALDVSGLSYDDGAFVHQWEYLGNDNQKWIVQDDGNGLYKLIAAHSNKALDVVGGSVENGANIHQWAQYSIPSQSWKIEKQTDGYFVITNDKSGKVLDVSNMSYDNGALIHQWDYAVADNQKWSFDLVSTNKSVVTNAKELAVKSMNESVLVYPNPATDLLNIDLPSNSNKVEIINVSGEVMISENVKGGKTFYDISSLSNGVYLIKVFISNKNFITQKVLINK